MLAPNKAVQKVGKPALFQFRLVSYSPSGAILALFTKKSNAVEIFKNRTNVLFQVTKMVDQAIIRTETIKCW